MSCRLPAGQRAREAITEGGILIKNEIEYAGLWQRFLALLIDVLLFCACFFPITRIVKGVWLMSPKDHNWVRGWFISDPLCLAFLAIMGLYFVLLEGWFGATLGKWVFGLRVIGPEGGRVGLWKGALRNMLRLVDGLPAFNLLGVILIHRCRERARFGDRITGTRVIRVSNKLDSLSPPKRASNHLSQEQGGMR